MQLPPDLMHTVGPLLDPPDYHPTNYYNILLARTQSGLGDWVMLLSVISMINQQYPNIDVYVDVENMPPSFNKLMEDFDIKYTLTANPDPYAFAYYSGHVVYPAAEACGEHFIAGMLRTINIRTGLNLRFDPRQLAQYKRDKVQAKWIESVQQLGLSTPYIAVALEAPIESPKHCPAYVRNEVIYELQQHLPVIEFADNVTPGDIVPDVRFTTHSYLPVTAAILRRAAGVVTLETGISHLAGHLHQPCITCYYGGATFFGNTGYPLQDPVGLAELPRKVGNWAAQLKQVAALNVLK